MSTSDMDKKVIILFLCTGNSCRSQMAEGWARHLRAHVIEPYSAGIDKHGLNPYAVRVMAEAGVDISCQHSKLVEELPVASFDYVITLCGHAHETCPFFPGRTIHQGFPDPPELAKNASSEEETLHAYRTVRDQIRRFIESLPESLPH
jgi:arsenate reductase (thioredoxin)